MLYDANRSKPSFPYWKFDAFNLNDWGDTECRTELRFAKNDLNSLMLALQIPEQIICEQRTACSGMEGLCIVLKRLSYPCRYTDMVTRFGRNPAELCLIFNAVLDHIYELHRHRLQSWGQPFLQPHRLNEYAAAVHQHGAPLENCFRFIDGTVRGIARPKETQRVMYNGHKRTHALKFQSVVIPNSLIANLSGPYEGKRHDSIMLQQSGLLGEL